MTINNIANVGRWTVIYRCFEPTKYGKNFQLLHNKLMLNLIQFIIHSVIDYRSLSLFYVIEKILFLFLYN